MSKLYGPSDVLSIHLGDGHIHTFFEPHQRELTPGYGIDDRSLPTLDCDGCREWCKNQGWHTNPAKVQKTTDEQDFEVEANRLGTVNMQLAAQAMGAAMSRMAAKDQEEIIRTRPQRARKGALAGSAR